MKTRRRIFFIGTCLCIAVIATRLGADSITLRDGKVITGVVKQLDGGYDVTLEDGKHRFISTEDVKSIKLSNEGKITDAVAHERLTSLERSVESERDLDRIIGRYDQFIAMNAGSDVVKTAQAEVAQWRDRRDKKMLKIGHRWMTPADRDLVLLDSAKRVDEVCGLMAAENFDRASAILRDAAADDPDNISYLYLNGVLQLRREQFPEAKRSFDAVAVALADHPPTILNLTVLAVQFKRWPQAVTYLEQAMMLAPASPEILDDVLEFEQLAPETTRRTGGFERLIKRAAPLEAALEARQAQRGLFRFGSKWVTQATLDKAKADRDAYDKKKADLEADYQATQESLRKTQENIGLTQRMIARIEADSYVQDGNGNVIRRAYPQAYWDLQRDLSLLQGQQQAATNHVADLRKQAEVVKASEPRAPFDGKLSPIDQRGVPVVLPSGPTTMPTTSPTTAPATPTTTPSATQPAVDAAPAATSGPASAPPSTVPASSRGLFE